MVHDSCHVDNEGRPVSAQVPSLQQLAAEKAIEICFATATHAQREAYQNNATAAAEDHVRYGPAWDRALRCVNEIHTDIKRAYGHASYEQIYRAYCTGKRRAHHDRWREELACLLRLVYYADFCEEAVRFHAEECMDERRVVQDNYSFNPHYYFDLYQRACRSDVSQIYEDCYLFLNGSDQCPELDAFETMQEKCRQDSSGHVETEMMNLCIPMDYQEWEGFAKGNYIKVWPMRSIQIYVSVLREIRIVLLRCVGTDICVIYDSNIVKVPVPTGRMYEEISDRRFGTSGASIYLEKTPTTNVLCLDHMYFYPFPPDIDVTQHFKRTEARARMLGGFR